MSAKQVVRFSRVAEGIYRYKSGGFYLRTRLAGKPIWHKLKNTDLPAAKREARDILNAGFAVQSKQAARTVEEFSQEELERYSAAADKTQKKVAGYHDKVVDHWPGGAAAPMSSVKERDVEQCIAGAVGGCGASYRNQFVQYLRRVFERALAAKAIASIPGANPGVRKKETIWKLWRVLPAAGLIPTVEQWREVVKTIRSRKMSDTHDEAADVVEAFALLGLGQAEVASLCWQDVNWEAGSLSVMRKKTGIPFTVPLNQAARQLLERRKKNSGGALTDKVFKIYSPKNAIHSACRDLQYPSFTPRSFRKLYITEALRAGVNVKVIAEMQGHQDGGKLILKTYSAEVNAKELAVAGDKMSAVFGGSSSAQTDAA